MAHAYQSVNSLLESGSIKFPWNMKTINQLVVKILIVWDFRLSKRKCFLQLKPSLWWWLRRLLKICWCDHIDLESVGKRNFLIPFKYINISIFHFISISREIRAGECKGRESWHGVKVGPGLRDPGPQDPGIRGPGPPSKFKCGTLGPSSKFKSGTPGPPSKFKSGTPSPFFNEFIFFRIFHCFFYFCVLFK